MLKSRKEQQWAFESSSTATATTRMNRVDLAIRKSHLPLNQLWLKEVMVLDGCRNSKTTADQQGVRDLSYYSIPHTQNIMVT